MELAPHGGPAVGVAIEAWPIRGLRAIERADEDERVEGAGRSERDAPEVTLEVGSAARAAGGDEEAACPQEESDRHVEPESPR